MRPTDKPEFAKTLTQVSSIKRVQLTDEQFEMWWLCMQDWEIGDFNAASVHLLKTCEWMPSPKHYEDLRKAGRDTAAEAWIRAVRHASSSAYRDGLTGDNTTDRAVASLGGYKAIAMCDEDKLHFLERRFSENYEVMQDASDVRLALPGLMPALENKISQLAHKADA